MRLCFDLSPLSATSIMEAPILKNPVREISRSRHQYVTHMNPIDSHISNGLDLLEEEPDAAMVEEAKVDIFNQVTS